MRIIIILRRSIFTWLYAHTHIAASFFINVFNLPIGPILDTFYPIVCETTFGTRENIAEYKSNRVSLDYLVMEF